MKPETIDKYIRIFAKLDRFFYTFLSIKKKGLLMQIPDKAFYRQEFSPLAWIWRI